MHKQPITVEAVQASRLLSEWDAVVDDSDECFTCIDPLETGDQAVDIRVPAVTSNIVATVHLRCYQGEEVVT